MVCSFRGVGHQREQSARISEPIFQGLRVENVHLEEIRYFIAAIFRVNLKRMFVLGSSVFTSAVVRYSTLLLRNDRIDILVNNVFKF